MIIQLTNRLEEEFVYNYIPSIIQSYTLSFINDYTNSKIITYIQQEYGINILDVLNKLASNISVLHVGSVYNIYINPLSMYSKLRYEFIINLLDKGNIHNKGINLFNNIRIFLNKNLDVLYNKYLMTSV